MLSVTGGIPWYLEQIQNNLNADTNIQNLCFMSSSILAQEVELIFHDLFDRRGKIYRKIVSALAKGTLEFNQIKEIIGYTKSGVLSNYLYDLQEAGFISRDYTWLLKTKKHQD